MEDINPLLSEKELEFKEDYGAFFTASRPRRGADRRLSRTSWIGIASTAVLLVSLLLTPLGCIMADNLGNLRQFFGIDVYRFSRQNYPDVTVTVKSSIVVNDKTLRIVLLGDSLVNRPCSFHNLREKIQADLSRFDYTFDIINCGFDGSKVSNMRLAPLNNCTLPANPHAVIMFWDSDVANVAERFSTDDEISQMRETYVVNVEFVVSTLLEKGIFVALGGTGILGEGAKLFAPHSERFIKKELMLESYNSINENIASTFRIPFIDVRKAFLNKIPFYQLCYKYCVTYDGEHENERGTVVIGKLFADVLSKWLTS